MSATPRWLGGTTFLVGFVVALLPAFGPFTAALLLLTRRFTLTRSDAWWAVAALLFALPSVVQGNPWDAVLATGSVVGPWIVFRTFVELARSSGVERSSRPLALGLLAGFAMVVIGGLVQSIGAIDFATSRTVANAIVWESSPALFGHTVLLLGGLIALLAREHLVVAWSAMGLAAFGILLSGSLEAALAWVLLAALHVWLRPAGMRRARLLEVGIIIGMLALAAGLAPLLGWGRIGFLLGGSDADAVRINLFAGTEVPNGDWWDDRWVEVSSETVTLAGEPFTAYTVVREDVEGWKRLQQLVGLEPGGTYTLSAWIERPDARDGQPSDEVPQPSLQGWGQSPGAAPFVVIGAWVDGAWQARLEGPGTLRSFGTVDQVGAWQRVSASFTFDGAEPLTWFVGFTPDARNVANASGRFAGLMLQEGPEATSYVPGIASSGLTFGYARLPLWQVAVDRIVERPWWGWGSGVFAQQLREARPGVERQEVVPAHPHNLALWVLHERGFVGFAGLALLLGVLLAPALRLRDVGFLAVVTAVLFANLLDATLLSGAVLYPLAATAGWRSRRVLDVADEGAQTVRQLFNRTWLAAADWMVAITALLFAWRFTQVGSGLPPATLFYALLLFPFMALRKGLYPGYGLTDAQELQRQVTAWFQASVLLVLARGALPETLAVPADTLLLTLALTLVGIPMARSLSKRLLLAIGVWGRPVLILGAGVVGKRVLAALTQSPRDGLHPIAAFDDDEALHGTTLQGVNVRGTLADARAYAQELGIRHAIVCVSNLDTTMRSDFATGANQTFRTVQFVPDLAGLPSDDVRATDLDGMLALEINVGLMSKTNQTLKRAFDLTAVTLGGLLISPLLLTIALLVKLTSYNITFGGLHFIKRTYSPSIQSLVFFELYALQGCVGSFAMLKQSEQYGGRAVKLRVEPLQET